MANPNLKIKTVSVTYGRKINLGNYNSCEASITVWADVDEDEKNIHAVMTQLWTMVKENVKTQTAKLRKKPQQENLFLGLPDYPDE